MVKKLGFRAGFALLLGMVSLAQAQVSLVSRSSIQNYHYFYAGGPTFDTTFTDSGLDLFDSMHTQYSEHNSDNSAGVYGFLYQQYLTNIGPNLGWITANGVSTVNIDGPAYAETWSQTPGNFLEFVFDVAGSVNVNLDETYSGIGPDATFLALQKQDSLGNWQFISGATNYFSGSLYGVLDYSGILDTGRYRMVSSMSVRATSNQLHQSYSDFTYTMTFDGMQPVPEPATIALMGMAAFAVRRKVKKSKR